MFSHTLPSKTVSAIFQMWLGFFSTPSQSLMFSVRTFLSTEGAVTLKRKRNQKKPDTVFRRRYPGTFLPIFSQFRRKTSVKKAFILILFAEYLSKSSQSENQRKYFSHFSVKSTYHDTLTSPSTGLCDMSRISWLSQKTLIL